MARVPITVMGFRCERCGHEWVPRAGTEEEPKVCPKCHSAWWNTPRKVTMTYEYFQDQIVEALRDAGRPLTWTEIRTTAGLPQLFPNNQWVHRLEKDIGLLRTREAGGIIHWQIRKPGIDDPPAKVAEPARPRPRRKQSAVE